MNQFASEAFFIGLKEGLKLSVTVFLVWSYLRKADLVRLKVPLAAGIALVFAASFRLMTGEPAGQEIRDFAVKLLGYCFGAFYLFSLGALLHLTGTDLLGPLGRFVRKNSFLVPLVFFLALFYFVPDMAGSSLYVADLSFLSGNRMIILMMAAAGLLVTVPVFLFLMKQSGRNATVMKLFGLPQVLLLLALIKLTAGGVRGFAEISLIPSVQAGLMKLVHDVVHQTFVIIMVPDHPILTTTAWTSIGILFGNTVTLWLSLAVLVLPLLLFVKKHFSETVPVPDDLAGGAQTRLYIKAFRDVRLIKSLPVFAFIIVILAVWFVEKGENAASLYNPEPKPVVASDGMVKIALNAPGDDLLDGRMHKFLLTVDGKTYRLMVLKKPDGALSFCLDACEICRPEGYAQGRENVVCLYCKTPIPLDTLGKPGGCNPIPVTALITEKKIVVDVSEIERKWQTVNSGEYRERVQ